MTIISSTQNPIVQHLKRLAEDSHYRREQKELLIEGKKLVLEALEMGSIKRGFFKEGLSLPGIDHTSLTEAPIQKISELKTSEGYLATVEYPMNCSLSGLKKILVLDKIQNPNNMGALIRSAVAFGFEGLFIVGGSCDPYSPKVIRASMGAVLKVPICLGTHEELEKLALENNLSIYMADAKGAPCEEIEIKSPMLLVLGNESKGPSFNPTQDIQKVALPIQNVESLNVSIAGSLLMYLMRGVS